jgi:protein phosphatase
MDFTLEAACLCNTGRVRKNNEDNFFFDGRCLEADNNGLKHAVTMKRPLQQDTFVAVFDGMGGENFGEFASFAAASCMRESLQRLEDYVVPERSFLNDLCQRLNNAVVARARELFTERMGSTLVAFYFSHGYAYVCNLGDSRAYRFREGEFLQVSEDHVEHREGAVKKKAPLTQHLGINPEDFLIEPYIAKGELAAGDQYLLCSDGLTDMLSNLEIASIMSEADTAESCAEQLVHAALEHGGRDNVTVIVCRIH